MAELDGTTFHGWKVRIRRRGSANTYTQEGIEEIDEEAEYAFTLQKTNAPGVKL